MNVKQMIIFFSFSAALFFFILIYNNVYAQNSDMPANTKMTSGNFKIGNRSSLDLPVYTSISKPAGAPKTINSEAEAEALFAKAVK
ncbi:MAG: hypothetical protein FWH43_03445 [Endomicrobia bacterium]|nr:hypothetical protein [Endomicrobiia bacterium]